MSRPQTIKVITTRTTGHIEKMIVPEHDAEITVTLHGSNIFMQITPEIGLSIDNNIFLGLAKMVEKK